MYFKYTTKHLPGVAHADEHGKRLIEEAGNLFYRNGFQAVGLDQVMDAVGISKTSAV